MLRSGEVTTNSCAAVSLFYFVVAVLLSSCLSVRAFDNIEADAVYERSIKEQIRKEFSVGLEMLKAQANFGNGSTSERYHCFETAYV
jgi:hypothetical protein